MARCVMCDKWGGLLGGKLTPNQLCFECADKVIPVIDMHEARLVKSFKAAQNSKRHETRLEKISVCLDSLNVLAEYELYRITNTNPTPSVFKRQLLDAQKDAVNDMLRDLSFEAEQKSADAKTVAGKVSAFNKSIERLHKCFDYVEDLSEIQLKIAELRRKRDQLHYQELKNKAAAAIAKNKPAAALSIYVDAFIVIKSDSTPDDEQQEILREIERKISELGGSVPEV